MSFITDNFTDCLNMIVSHGLVLVDISVTEHWPPGAQRSVNIGAVIGGGWDLMFYWWQKVSEQWIMKLLMNDIQGKCFHCSTDKQKHRNMFWPPEVTFALLLPSQYVVSAAGHLWKVSASFPHPEAWHSHTLHSQEADLHQLSNVRTDLVRKYSLSHQQTRK